MSPVPNQPRAIYLWVSNSARSSYFSLSVDSHTFFRLNYPLRLNRWYHSCTSWNGRSGEWQIWVNAERVGRGFHNRVSTLFRDTRDHSRKILMVTSRGRLNYVSQWLQHQTEMMDLTNYNTKLYRERKYQMIFNRSQNFCFTV
jgi:hypothetical protein